MAGNRLTQRVEALEGMGSAKGWKLPAVWVHANESETSEQACARYEAEHGAIGDHLALVWMPVSGPVQCA